MKKTLIAICIAATPLASQAATVYQNDETSVGIGGEFDVYLNQNNHSSNPNADFDVDVWAKIQADINHKINKDVSVFASAEFESGTYYGSSNDHDLSNSDQSVRTDDVYVGATFFDSLGVAFGEIGDFGDSLDAITIDNTNEGYGYMDDFNQSIESKGHAASIKYSQNNLELIADTYLSDDPMLDTAYGVSATYLLESNVGDFGIGLSYQDRGNRVEWDLASVGDNSTMGMMASYQVSGFNIAMNYAALRHMK
ncbi:porin, partial [Vibrio lentus]